MVRNKIVLLPVLCLLFFVQSCVHGGLDDCPPMVRYAVAFEYTHHLGSSTLSNGTSDRFLDDVRKVNLYVFDDKGLIFTTETKLSPYDKNFNIPLEGLPSGNYHIIAWGNAMDTDFSITPSLFEPGKTTFEQARLILDR